MTCQHGGEDGRGTLHDARLNLDLVGSPIEDEDYISVGSDALQGPFLSVETSPRWRIVASFALVGGTRRAHVQEEAVKMGVVRGSMNGLGEVGER